MTQEKIITIKQLKALKIGECVELGHNYNIGDTLTRVPNGWVYRRSNMTVVDYSACFIPEKI